MATTTAPPKGAATPDQEPEAPGRKGGRRKKLVVLLLLLVLGGGAAYWFFLKPVPEGEPAPEPGAELALEPIQVNLAGGHYLKVGVSLQLTADAHEVSGGKALDAVIELFSGRSIEEVTKQAERQKLKEELLEELEHDYHGDVIDVYFVDFVAQ